MITYLDRPLLDTRPDFDGVESGLLDDFTFDSVSIGRATPWKPTIGPRRTVRYPFALVGHDAIGDFRRFFSDRAGRRRGFWLPIYLFDFKLTENADSGATEIVVGKTGLGGALSTFSQFGHLILADWLNLEAVAIDSVDVGGEIETITLSSPLERDWPKKRTICGGLIFARPVDDQIKFAFRGIEFARTSIKFVELPAEYAEAEDGAAPLFLYKVERDGQTWRYVDFGVDQEIDEETWTASNITHGEITAGVEIIGEPIELRIATDDSAHPLRALLDRNLMSETRVTIYESSLDDLTIDESAPLYKGRVEDVRAESKGRITCQLSSVMRVAELAGPRVNAQRLCNHKTYSQFCGVNPADFTTTGTIDAISGDPAYVDASEFGDKATAESDPNWFALGLVTCGSERRMCVGQSGNRLYLNAPFKSASVGAAISALAGDDRRAGTCLAKFDNISNFLGFPYMPNKNPQFEALETPKPSGGKKS